VQAGILDGRGRECADVTDRCPSPHGALSL